MNFLERACEMEATLARDGRLFRMYRRAIAAIDPQAISKIQRKYRTDLADFDPDGPFKYGDIPFWVAHKAQHAALLELDRRAPCSLLDIGTGCAHFLAIANALGHRSVGIDVDMPFYADVCNALGIDRRCCTVKAGERLPSFGMRFDVVTAFWTNFNYIFPTAQAPGRCWSKAEWEFFLRDIEETLANTPATVFLEVNPEAQPDGTARLNEALLAWLRGTAGSGEGAMVLLSLPRPRLMK